MLTLVAPALARLLGDVGGGTADRPLIG